MIDNTKRMLLCIQEICKTGNFTSEMAERYNCMEHFIRFSCGNVSKEKFIELGKVLLKKYGMEAE